MKKYILFLPACLLLCLYNANGQKEIRNLQTFSKAYGYVKYFHPSHENGSIDWNKFSALGASEISKCKNRKELIKTLNELFKPIGPGITFSKSDNPYELSVITPDKLDEFEATYWQHLGVSTNEMVYQYPTSMYNSVRVNQMRKINESDRYGNLFTFSDVEKFNSKEIKYTGWVKLKSGTKGTGHLWMRIFKADKSAGFFANMDASPITSTEWKQFEIIGTMDEIASRITFGTYLLGEGTLYLDKLKLFYKTENEWIEIPNTQKDFEEYALGAISDQSEWTANGKGYSHNISSNEKQSGDQCVEIIYNGKFKKEMGESIFDSFPKFGELIEKEIGDGIYCQIPLHLYVKNDITFPKSLLIDSFQKQLEDFDENNNLEAMRFGNVINTYNVIQHFFPYFDEVDVNWDKEFEIALKQSFEDETGDDHLITLQKLIAPLNDGHAVVTGGDKLYNYMPSIFWQWIEDKLVITNLYDKSLDLKIGDEVTKINRLPILDYFKEVNARISAATKGYKNHRSQIESLLGGKDSKLIIEVEGKTVSLMRDKAYEAYTFSEIEIQKNTYKELDDNIMYINLDVIDMQGINKLLPKLNESKGIICDFRGYSWATYDFLSHFTKEDIDYTDCNQTMQIIYPDQENVAGIEASGSGTIKAKTPYLGDKKVVFIIDGRALSAAEGFMSDVKSFNLGTIVGQPTAGTNGVINPFHLLGNYQVYYTGMRLVNYDGSQFHGIGVLPDVYVEKTIEGIKNGRDEFLDKAIEIINE